jgi:hypothetical protein
VLVTRLRLVAGLQSSNCECGARHDQPAACPADHPQPGLPAGGHRGALNALEDAAEEEAPDSGLQRLLCRLGWALGVELLPLPQQQSAASDGGGGGGSSSAAADRILPAMRCWAERLLSSLPLLAYGHMVRPVKDPMCGTC